MGLNSQSNNQLTSSPCRITGRHNARPQDTADQMAGIVRGMDGKRLEYGELVGD